MKRLATILLGAALLVAPTGTFASTLNEELGGIPSGPGDEETYYLCAACHSFRLVSQQGLSREAWEETLVWMVEEQEMDEPEPDELKLILDYLAKYYGTDRLAHKLAKK